MTDAADKGYKGLGMEGSIARWYEKNTRNSMDEFRKDAERLKAFLPNGGDLLEVAPGPGFLAIELARDPRIRVTGLDISKTFVELAKKNAEEAGVREHCHKDKRDRDGGLVLADFGEWVRR